MSDVKLSFIVHCGSDILVIKCGVVRPNQIYYPGQKCDKSGIGHGNVSTLGTTQANITLNDTKIPQTFHIVRNDIPIPTDGILGRDFLITYKCNVDYDSWLLKLTNHFGTFTIPIVNRQVNSNLIPARCELIKQFENFNIQEDSVIFSEEICQGVFCTNTIVNKNNCCVRIINTTNKEVLLPENFHPKHEPLANFYYCTMQNNANKEKYNERANKLKSELKLENNDPHFKDKLEKLCVEFNDVFSLQGDPVSQNNLYEQNIILNDQKPIYIKNYRLPEAQKQEIHQQVQTMLNDGIIQKLNFSIQFAYFTRSEEIIFK